MDFVREGNPRTGDPSELRLCEQWTATAKSVFRFDVQGSVAKSTHAGLPWLLWLRQMPDSRQRLHFWPFDGFDVPEGKSVIVEAYTPFMAWMPITAYESPASSLLSQWI